MIILASLWRRMLGGWLGVSRSVLVLTSLLLIVYPLYVLSIYKAIILALCWLWHWTDGHDWTSTKAMLYRYSLPLTVAALFIGWPTLSIVGPLITFGYWATQRWPISYKNPFIDGPIALAELWSGFITAFIINLTALAYNYQWLCYVKM